LGDEYGNLIKIRNMWGCILSGGRDIGRMVAGGEEVVGIVLNL